MIRILAFLLFLSGATALAGEVVWMRMLGLVLGNTTWAATAVVASWMGGMALGSALGARLSRSLRRPILAYALAEAGIAAFYAASPQIFEALQRLALRLGPDLSGRLVPAAGERLALAVLVLLPPTILMGLTLPVLIEALRSRGLIDKLGRLYAANTLGAVVGVFGAAYLGLPWIGEHGTLAAAAAIALFVAAAAAIAGHRLEIPPRDPTSTSGFLRPFLVVPALFGFIALAAELIWVRILVLHLGSRVYAFAILLGCYLIGLSLGSWWIGRRGPQIKDARRSLARLCFLTSLLLLLQLLAFGQFSALLGALATLFQGLSGFAAVQLLMLLGTALVVVPVASCFGAAFPLVVAADSSPGSDGEHTGQVGAANTFGAIIGSLAATFALVPMIGSQRSILLIAALELGLALSLVPVSRRMRVSVAALALTIAGLAIALPPDWVLRQAEIVQEGELVMLDESMTATVLIKRYQGETHGQREWLSLELNGVNVAGSSAALLAIQQLQAHLPLLQVDEPRSVVHIGFGSGGTCWAVSRHPEVEQIEVVDLSPEVLAASNQYFADINHGVLDDPKVSVRLNDGRNFLLASKDRTWDVILSDSIHPVYSGNSTLYTREYFELCRRRLSDGGIVSMWLPTYSLDPEGYLRILRAFWEVFPHTVVWYDTSTVNEFTVVTGQVEPGPVTLDWDRFDDPALEASLEIAGAPSMLDIMSNVLLGPAEVERLVAGVEPHLDDLPYVEYRSGRIGQRGRSWKINFEMLVKARSMRNPFAPSFGTLWRSASDLRDRRLEAQLKHLEEMITLGDLADGQR